MKKHALTDDFQLAQLEIYVLVTPLRPVQLAWYLNKNVQIDLKRSEDLVYTHAKSTSFHPLFMQTFPEMMLDFRLIRNRGTNSYLLNRHKQADYLFCTRFEEPYLKPDVRKMLEELRDLHFLFLLTEEQLAAETRWLLMEGY